MKPPCITYGTICSAALWAHKAFIDAAANPCLLSSEAVSATGLPLASDAHLRGDLRRGDKKPGNDRTIQQSGQDLRWQPPDDDLGWGRLLRMTPVEASLHRGSVRPLPVWVRHWRRW